MGVFPQRDPRVQSTSRMRAQGPGRYGLLWVSGPATLNPTPPPQPEAASWSP